jgi:molecular chaperone Hsp33
VSAPPGTDQVRRFLLEEFPVRGQLVQLESSWAALREHARYPEPVRDLLGQAVAAAVLLASTLKFEGGLTLQMQGSGAVRLLVAQCTHDFRIRAVAHYDEARVAADFAMLAGAGRITVTVESLERGAPYQGIVPLEGASFAECIDGYFATSEQLPTHVRLAADATRAGGLLVQKLPGSSAQAAADPEAAAKVWARVHGHAATLDARDLLYAPAETLVRSSATVDDVRLFAGSPVKFECRCTRDRVLSVLRALGEDEVRDVLVEQGAVTVTCEFCHRPYVFDAIDVTQAFGPPSAPAPKRLN